MLGKSLLIFSAIAIALAAAAVPAQARRDAVAGSSQPRSELNNHSDDYGYYPGRRSFYGYTRHRHIDGGGDDGGSIGRPLTGSYDGSPNYDGNYGSPYYGTNYGAPYYGGAYYDRGVYYRERRD
jgi:hypothetical protein